MNPMSQGLGSKGRSVIEVVFAIPGELRSPTGGYGYARRLLDLLPAHDISALHLALPSGYPHPAAGDLAETERMLAGTAPGAVLLIDGLAYGAMPAALIARLERPIVALVHHPLGLENGLPSTRRAELIESETKALSAAAQVIVTSPLTARLLQADFGVPSGRITVAEPGTDPATRSPGTGSPVQLLAVGTVSPRKGYDILVAALRTLVDLDWHATIAGATDRVPDATERLEHAIAEGGLGGRVTLVGALGPEPLGELYAQAGILVSPSLFEGYGMVLAEALAHGLPLVASTGGAAAETVPDAAAIKVPPGDAPALANALRRLIVDRDLRANLADASWSAGQSLPRWSDTAQRVASVLRRAAQ
jgi:glycosyltransferase involved in cell wall biosynthesis